MDVGPNELTTLLAKYHSEDYENDNPTTTTTKTTTKTTTTTTTTTSAQDAYSANRLSRLSWHFFLIEPLVFMLLFAYNLSSTIMMNQIIYQTCTVIFNFNESDCKLLGTNNASEHIKQIETTVQPYAARVFMVNSLIQSVVPALCGAFIGAWSDNFGRKPLMVTAFTGYALYYAISATFAYLAVDNLVTPWYYILAILPHALLGGSVTYSVALLCFISDITNDSERPYRMVLYEAAIYTGLMVGAFVSGYLFEATNAHTVFATSAILTICALLVIILFVPESLNVRNVNDAATTTTTTTTTTATTEEAVATSTYGSIGTLEEQQDIIDDQNYDASAETSSINSLLIGATASQMEQPILHYATERERDSNLQKLFDFNLLKEMYETCTKPRPYSDKALIYLIFACMLTVTFAIDGSIAVFYLFIREKFHWAVKKFTTYETISILVTIIGNICGIWLLRKLLKMSIINLAIISLISQFASAFTKAFALADWYLYLAIAFGALRAMTNPMCRTALTKIVPPNELGKLFAFYSLLESFLPFAAKPLYTFIYTISLASFPGFFMFFSSQLFLLAIVLQLAILRTKRSHVQRYQTIFS